MSAPGKRKPLNKLRKIPQSVLKRSPDEGGPRVIIWISECDRDRIERGGSDWYKPTTCSTQASPELNVRTVAKDSAVEDGTFWPDRDDELESMLEWCEAFDVPDVQAEQRTRQHTRLAERRKNLKKGNAFLYANIGYGMTSYETGGGIIKRKNGRLFTKAFDKIGMEWDTRRGTWVFDGGLGLVTTIILPEELPKGASVS